MKSCRNSGMESPRCQILPAWGGGGEAAAPPAVPGLSVRSPGDAPLPDPGKPHRISAPQQISLPGQSGGPACPAEPALELPRVGPAAHQRTSCSPGALIGAVHSAQEGNIGQPTRILPRRHGHSRLPETPAAAPRLLRGEEKRIAFLRGRKNYEKKPHAEGPGGSERALRNVRAQGMVFAAGAAIRPGSGALSLPTRCPAEHVPRRLQARGDVYQLPASLAGLCFSEEPPKARGRPASPQCGTCSRRSPGEPPGRAPSIRAASPAVTQRPPLPPGSRESPAAAPRDAPAKRGGKRGAAESGSSGRWEIPQGGEFAFQGFRLASCQLRERFWARGKPGFVCATRWEAAEGRLQ